MPLIPDASPFSKQPYIIARFDLSAGADRARYRFIDSDTAVSQVGRCGGHQGWNSSSSSLRQRGGIRRTSGAAGHPIRRMCEP